MLSSCCKIFGEPFGSAAFDGQDEVNLIFDL